MYYFEQWPNSTQHLNSKIQNIVLKPAITLKVIVKRSFVTGTTRLLCLFHSLFNVHLYCIWLEKL